MNKLLKGLTFFIFSTTAINSAFATDTNNFLGGIARGQMSADLSPKTAGMANAEVGPRNYRVSGTLGTAINPCNRVKISGEWLWQDIDYSFLTAASREWVQQTAVSLGYQLLFNNRIISYFDITGYYSYAPNKSLAGVDFINATTGNFYTDVRRIAGSNAGGISPAVHLTPWRGAQASLALNWDDVAYNNRNIPQVTAKGFGGTAELTQAVRLYQQNFLIDASAAIRTPFNAYQLAVNWVKPLCTNELSIGLFSNYTKGKSTLPNIALFGFNLAYAIDTPTPVSSENSSCVKPDSLLAWVSKPAVYMPETMAIKDETTVFLAPHF